MLHLYKPCHLIKIYIFRTEYGLLTARVNMAVFTQSEYQKNLNEKVFSIENNSIVKRGGK